MKGGSAAWWLVMSRAARLGVAAGALVCAGCASPPAPPQVNAPDAGEVRTVLLGEENGLEVRQWLVVEAVETIPAVLLRYRAEDAQGVGSVPQETHERLRRNGFRLVRVPAAQLDSIAAELQGLVLDRQGWHGQVLRWQEMHSSPVGPVSRAVAIDGRVRRFDRGSFQLMSRSWLVMMEDGPFIQLELLPQFRGPDDQYRRLLGQQPSAQVWPSLAVDLLLEQGYAYILLSESPVVEWEEKNDAPHGGARPVPVGPEVVGPTTLGEMMLSSEGTRRSRGMLVFVPRIAPGAFPQMVNAGSVRR